MDHLTKKQRSQLMARIKCKDTKPEKAVRSLLHSMGFRFRLHRRELPGCPDIVLVRYRVAIFVHGCFWHSHEECSLASRPSTNVEYWQQKLRKNKERDKEHIALLEGLGWKVLVVWECQTKEGVALRRLLEAFWSSLEVNASVA